MTSYDDLTKVLAGYQQASQTYEKISHFPEARNAAAQFALEELGEEGEVEVQILTNPETPIETVAQGLKLSLARRQQKLEELVENKFEEILNDGNIKKEKLEESLTNYFPRKDVNKKYKELVEAHKVRNNLVLYENREKIEPETVKGILSEMAKEIVKYYEAQYKEETGDSNEVKKQKELLKNFFLSLYVREGKPVVEGENITKKYFTINKDKLEDFGESLKTKEALADYIQATLPEDKNTRLKFLGRLIG